MSMFVPRPLVWDKLHSLPGKQGLDEWDHRCVSVQRGQLYRPGAAFASAVLGDSGLRASILRLLDESKAISWIL